MYKIIDFKSPEAAVIYHQPTGQEKIVHVNHLRPLFGDAAWDKIYLNPGRVAPKRLANQKLRALLREGGRAPKEPTKVQPARASKVLAPAPITPEDAPEDAAPALRAKRQRTTGPTEDDPYAKPRTPKRKRSPSGEDPPRVGPAAGTRSQTPAPLTPAATPPPDDSDSSSESQMSCDQSTPEATATVPMTVDSSSTPKRPRSDTDSESNGQPPLKSPHTDNFTLDTDSEESLDAPLRVDSSDDESDHYMDAKEEDDPQDPAAVVPPKNEG